MSKPQKPQQLPKITVPDNSPQIIIKSWLNYLLSRSYHYPHYTGYQYPQSTSAAATAAAVAAMYPPSCYSTFYMPQCTLATNSPALAAAAAVAASTSHHLSIPSDSYGPAATGGSSVAVPSSSTSATIPIHLATPHGGHPHLTPHHPLSAYHHNNNNHHHHPHHHHHAHHNTNKNGLLEFTTSKSLISSTSS